MPVTKKPAPSKLLVRFPPGLKRALEVLADEQGTSLNQIILLALGEYLGRRDHSSADYM